MTGQAYVGTTKRSFYAAIFHMLENEYSILGSHRILEMLANDLQNLVDEFFPPTERIAPGWMVFVGTKATGGKARVGKTAEDQHNRRVRVQFDAGGRTCFCRFSRSTSNALYFRCLYRRSIFYQTNSGSKDIRRGQKPCFRNYHRFSGANIFCFHWHASQPQCR